MADLSITASEVKQDLVNSQTFNGIAGVAITAGENCRLDTSDNRVKLVDVDDLTTPVESARTKGVALNDAAIDQTVTLQISGTVTLGASATVAKGTIYVASDTSGKIKPSADLVSGDHVSIIGVGNASDGLSLTIFNSEIKI